MWTFIWSVLLSMIVELVKWLLSLNRPLTTREQWYLSRIYSSSQKVCSYCAAKGIPPIEE